MIYSDFHINKSTKIEILPTDSVSQNINVLYDGDRLITVFRPIDGNLAVNSFKLSFFEEIKQRFEVGIQDINELLFQTIAAFGVLLSCPPSDYVPQDKIELIIVYIKDDIATIAKVGKIGVKKKTSGRFNEIFENNSNPLGPNEDTNILLKSITCI